MKYKFHIWFTFHLLSPDDSGPDNEFLGIIIQPEDIIRQRKTKRIFLVF